MSCPPVQMMPIRRHAVTDSRSALADALAEHLRAQSFCIWSADGSSQSFALREVNRVWPEPSQPLVTPCATVLDTEGTNQEEGEGFAPSAIEESYEVFGPGTVLWWVGESQNNLNLEFWGQNEPEREAIAAELSTIFNPDENYRGLRLDLGPRYFNRVGRYTLNRWERIDTESSIYPRERRLSVSVLAETDEVQLRNVKTASIKVRTDVVDPTLENISTGE